MYQVGYAFLFTERFSKQKVPKVPYAQKGKVWCMWSGLERNNLSTNWTLGMKFILKRMRKSGKLKSIGLVQIMKNCCSFLLETSVIFAYIFPQLSFHEKKLSWYNISP